MTDLTGGFPSLDIWPVSRFLEEMDMSQYTDHFERNCIGPEEFLKLSATHIQLIFPSAEFPLGVTIKFMQKYCELMKKYEYNVDPSLNWSGSVTEIQCSANRSVKNGTDHPTDKEDSDTMTDDDEPLSKLARVSNGKNLDPSIPHKSGSQLFAAISNTKKAQSASESCNSKLCSGTQSLASYSCTPKATPLVDQAKIGHEHNLIKLVDAHIANLDLAKKLNKTPLCSSVFKSYEINGNRLLEADRSLILDTIIPWLMSKTLYPSFPHYERLTDKICALFPSEKASTRFVPPLTEGKTQRNAKGKLPDRFKNSKERLRKKNALPSKEKQQAESQIEIGTTSSEEKVAIEWLKRNNEPLDELKRKWRSCAKVRLSELLFNGKMTPAVYIEKWHNVLKLASSFQLVLDDFEILPDVYKGHYEPLRGKANVMMANWINFSKFVKSLLESDHHGLAMGDLKKYRSLFEAAGDSEDAKDFIILHLLPLLCKQRGRVKLGKTIIKPSTEESRRAFMLHVPDAANVNEFKRKRQELYSRFEAPIQPYIVVVGESETSVKASYVILNEVPWKMSSVLQAVDVCFKTCFSLNCGYPPEAEHLWLLLQNALYGIKLNGDKHVQTVSDFLESLNAYNM